MSVLWFAAGEEIEFDNLLTGVVTDTSDAGTYFRNTYVRACLRYRGTAGLSAGSRMADGKPITPVTSLWMSCQFHKCNGSTANLPDVGVGRSSDVQGGIFVGCGSDEQKLALFKVSTGGTVTKLASEDSTSWGNDQKFRVDMHITTFNDAATNVKVYLNGNATALIDWTGSTTGLGITDLDCFRWVSHGTPFVGQQDHAAVSEVILADEDTRAFVGVATLAPNAAGTTNTFDSGAYTDVDETVLDDADMITAGSNGEIFECNLTNAPAGSYSVRGVKVTARASKGASGPGTLKLGVDSGGTDNGVDKALTTNLTSYERLMSVNPVSTNPFTIAEVNALQIYVESAA